MDRVQANRPQRTEPGRPGNDARAAGLTGTGLTLVSHGLCPFVQRAVIALEEKGVPYERRTIDLDDKPRWFEELSPTGKVPLLMVHREGAEPAIVFESAVICEYIEETADAARLHPADALRRAQHRAWVEFASSLLNDIYVLETSPDARAFAERRQRLVDAFARIERTLGNGPYFDGEAFTYVDAAFAPVFRYFDAFDELLDLGVLDGKPNVQAWRARLSVRPSVARAVAPDYRSKLLAFLRSQPSHLMAMPGRPKAIEGERRWPGRCR